MVFYDASVLIDYLADDETAVTFVQDNADGKAVTIPLVVYELYEGEIFRREATDFDALDSRLGWLTVVETDRRVARTAGELQSTLEADGAYLAPGDAFVAGAARSLNETLATRDGAFDADAVRERVDVALV